MTPDEPWWQRGACKDATDPDDFSPISDPSPAATRARRYCEYCPVRQACLRDAIKTRDWNGIRGGLNGNQRRAYARKHGLPEVTAATSAQVLREGGRS